MTNWLHELVKQHDELESPESFWYWGGLTAISAVVKDNVWIDRQIHNLYPNIFAMLHAESGLRKGPAISMARQLVQAVNNTRIISGRSSIQGILKELGTATTLPGGKISAKSTAFICSSELSSSIVEDKVATKLLTDLYDRQYNFGEWQSLLKMETFKLKDPTVTMFTATNEAMSEDFFTRSAIQGGYFARTFIIHETKNQNINSLTYRLLNPPNYLAASEYLKHIATLKGSFAAFEGDKSSKFKYKKMKKTKNSVRELYFSEVGILYDDWYDSFYNERAISEIKDTTGTLNRFGDSVLKVAMLLSLAEKPELVISPCAMAEAIKECTKLIGNVHKTTLGKDGMSNIANLKALIINIFLLRENNTITRTALMKKLWMHYSTAEELDGVMLSFDHAGLIKTASVGNQIIFTMPKEQVIELQRLIASKTTKVNGFHHD
jgi:hypothetical protein